MGKAVLISIRPQWCDLIVIGKKTVEVRKTAPKLPTPFKCYIYQTLPKSGDWNESDGRVIGEFICDKIYSGIICCKLNETDIVCPSIMSERVRKDACLSEVELHRYCDGKYAYGWHISNLVIYDKPKKLCEFFRWYEDGDDIRPCQNGKKCKHIIYDYGEGCEACAIDFDGTDCPYYKVTRPPQSWMYVEELK